MGRHRQRGGRLTIGGTKVDLIYRDLGEVLGWTAAAEAGQFEIHREVGYVAGIATYVLAGELALGRMLAGDLPRPRFPPNPRQTAPAAWFRLAAGALHFAEVHAGRRDRVACLANLCQAVLAAAQGRLAAAGEWVLNEKRLAERAGLADVQDRLGQAASCSAAAGRAGPGPVRVLAHRCTGSVPGHRGRLGMRGDRQLNGPVPRHRLADDLVHR